MKRTAAVLVVALAPLASAPALADTIFRDRPADGKLVEQVPLGPHRWEVTVWVTDATKNVIDAEGFPKKENTANGRAVEFKIPKKVQKKGTGTEQKPPEFADVFDVKQTITKLGSELETSDLEIESLMFDPSTGEYFLNPVFGTLARKVGFGAVVRIPDLFADTNGDGELGAGDILYSLVDLNVFTDYLPVFDLGDSFEIVNGVVAALPGMLFSTTPFTFDPATGFGGTLYSGTGLAETAHLISATPEPGTLVLMASALPLLALLRRARRRVD